MTSGDQVEPKGDNGTPTAIVYVRSIRPGSAPLEAVAERLRIYGKRNGFVVDAVFQDDVTADRDSPYSGFLALIEQVRTREIDAVIVPSPAHLSLIPEVRRLMVRMLAQAGAELVPARSEREIASASRFVPG